MLMMSAGVVNWHQW